EPGDYAGQEHQESDENIDDRVADVDQCFEYRAGEARALAQVCADFAEGFVLPGSERGQERLVDLHLPTRPSLADRLLGPLNRAYELGVGRPGLIPERDEPVGGRALNQCSV